MPPDVLVRAGRTVYRVRADGTVAGTAELGGSITEFAQARSEGGVGPLSPELLELVRRAPLPSVGDVPLLRALAGEGISIPESGPIPSRNARERIEWPTVEEERAAYSAWSRASVRRALADPEQVLIALAREEERVDRGSRAQADSEAHWLDERSGELGEYRTELDQLARTYADHHARLETRLSRAAGATVPNLTRVVGPKVAGRLVAAAGGRSALARMDSSRLQLLGARRRPGAGRGPRHGVLFGATGMDEVPVGRRGAFARSLAALAAIAVRADALTGHDVSATLEARRLRRIEALRRRRDP